MKRLFSLFLLMLFLAQCEKPTTSAEFFNDDKSIKINFFIDNEGEANYQAIYQNKIAIDTSRLGVVTSKFEFAKGLSIEKIDGPSRVEDSYTMLQGKQRAINYSAEEYTVHLKDNQNNKLDIIFRLSDDGFAFRYHFPNPQNEYLEILEETSEYNFPSDSKSWLQPMSKAKSGWEHTNPSYEEHYLAGVSPETKSPIKEGFVYPALFETDSVWALVSETGLDRNYVGTRLKHNSEGILQVTFPQKEEVFPDGKLNPNDTTSFYSPWRILALGSLADITESTLGTDLAIPSKVEDTYYVQGGLATWSWALLKDDSVNYETTKEFIDYASKMNWPYCLIDVNWNNTIGFEKMKELVDYASEKNVKLLLWYNSSGSWNTTKYEPKSKLLTHTDRMKEFKMLHDMRIAGVKVDFFGGDGQSMIAYYHDILQDAAANKLLVNFHGATLPRGWQRTYPNLMTVEAIKGLEFITFFQENADAAPEHCTIIPFTRNVFDPMDFTPMVLDSIPNMTRRTTSAFELALPVLYLSGVQHIAETNKGMEKMPDFVVDYLKGLPTLWDESKFISGYPGKDVVMARRKGNTWYVVGINGENKSKEMTLDLSFINRDGYLITDDNEKLFDKVLARASKETKLKLKPNGGFVMRF